MLDIGSDSQNVPESDAEASDGRSIAKASSTDAASEMSEEEDAEDALLVVVDSQKQWTTLEDRAGSSIVLLANELRDHPLLPPCLSNPVNSFLDVDLCIAFPLSHCAFKACPWTPDAVLCQPWSCHEDAWAVCNGRWYRRGSATWHLRMLRTDDMLARTPDSVSWQGVGRHPAARCCCRTKLRLLLRSHSLQGTAKDARRGPRHRQADVPAHCAAKY